MPDYEYKLWDENCFDIESVPYTKEAYENKKYAFVSDYVRLLALYEEGGIYLDVDFRVYRSFDDLLCLSAFAGFEGSKTNPVMMGVIASEAGGVWVKQQLDLYKSRHFLKGGVPDLTTNVRYITDHMISHGFLPNGQEQNYEDLHVFPVDYFCPRLTTGEYRMTDHTYCEHLGVESSWAPKSWKSAFLGLFPDSVKMRMILLKRKLFG